MTLSIGVVCEAPADLETGCDLADRVFCRGGDWIEEEMLDHLRQWRGFSATDDCLLWKDVKHLAAKKNVRVHGHFDGKPAAPDALAALKALRLMKTSKRPPDAFVLLRDADDQTQRREGLEQAKCKFGKAEKVVIGLAHTKRECWVLAGFEPREESEKRRLETARRELGFDPCEQAERLTARHDADKKSAKRVLRSLTDGDSQREAECWRTTNIELLERRGKRTGLAHFLKEVSDILVPLLSPNR